MSNRNEHWTIGADVLLEDWLYGKNSIQDRLSGMATRMQQPIDTLAAWLIGKITNPTAVYVEDQHATAAAVRITVPMQEWANMLEYCQAFLVGVDLAEIPQHRWDDLARVGQWPSTVPTHGRHECIDWLNNRYYGVAAWAYAWYKAYLPLPLFYTGPGGFSYDPASYSQGVEVAQGLITAIALGRDLFADRKVNLVIAFDRWTRQLPGNLTPELCAELFAEREDLQPLTLEDLQIIATMWAPAAYHLGYTFQPLTHPRIQHVMKWMDGVLYKLGQERVPSDFDEAVEMYLDDDTSHLVKLAIYKEWTMAMRGRSNDFYDAVGGMVVQYPTYQETYRMLQEMKEEKK